MNVEQAVRFAEIIVAVAYLQQSLEFIYGLRAEKMMGLIQAILSLILLAGFQVVFVEAGLLAVTFLLLRRFQGPYNGGSDCMSTLVLLCLFLSHIAPTRFWQELALAYLAFQLTFSYFQAGYIKVINPAWRSGQALIDVFAITAYPSSEKVRSWANSPRLVFYISWLVILFELFFPLLLLQKHILTMGLIVAATFHLANAYLFGLNRFFWVWPASYPIIIWFQQRLFL